MLGYIQTQDARNVARWSQVCAATSPRNTLNLFKHMHSVYESNARKEPRRKRSSAETSKSKPLLHKLVSDTRAGETLIQVFQEYSAIIGMLRGMDFRVTVDLEDGSKKTEQKLLEELELQQLSKYFFFACNCCMHMKSFDNQIKKSTSTCSPVGGTCV